LDLGTSLGTLLIGLCGGLRSPSLYGEGLNGKENVSEVDIVVLGLCGTLLCGVLRRRGKARYVASPMGQGPVGNCDNSSAFWCSLPGRWLISIWSSYLESKSSQLMSRLRFLALTPPLSWNASRIAYSVRASMFTANYLAWQTYFRR
jgi:hypothetical protein